jgi:hydrogenase expression/formation protein HypC
MCLGIPGRVVAKVEGYGGQLALVDVLGSQKRVNIGMLEDHEQAALAPGEWVIIHMGFIVERVDEAAAEKAMAGLELMGRSRADADVPTGAPPPGVG